MSPEDLLSYYERELTFLRQYVREFAARYPKIASRLSLTGGMDSGSMDLHVERLVESFALMAARTARHIDDDYPRFTEALFETLYPHYLRAFPSCSIVHFEMDSGRAAQMSAAVTVPRGTQLYSRPLNGSKILFRTAYDVTLSPLQLTGAKFRSIADVPRTLRLPALRVELTLEGNFGSKLWIFTQALGGTPDRRDDYPAIGDIKTAPGTPARRMSDPDPSAWSGVPGDGPPVILPGMDVVAWPADPISKIGDGVSGGLGKPLHISAYEDVGAVWQRLQDSFKRPPATRDTTVQAWNDYHLHRNPNEGRAPDSEDLDPKLWKK